MSRVRELTELYKDGTIAESIEGQEKIKGFLEYSAKHYKLSFNQRIFAYAQSPDATAFSTFDTWNDVYNRRIKSGSKATLIPDEKQNNGYRYVFDVSDTYGTPVPEHWQMNEEHHKSVLDKLTLEYALNNYNSQEANTVEAAIKMASNQLCLLNSDEVPYYCKAYNVNETEYMKDIQSCAVEIISRRLGLKPNDDIDFERITNQYPSAVTETMLNISSDNASEILKSIEVAVKDYNKNLIIERDYENEQIENNIPKERRRINVPESESTGQSHSNHSAGEIRQDGIGVSNENTANSSEVLQQDVTAESNIAEGGQRSDGDGNKLGEKIQGGIPSAAAGEHTGHDSLQQPNVRDGRGSSISGTGISTARDESGSNTGNAEIEEIEKPINEKYGLYEGKKWTEEEWENLLEFTYPENAIEAFNNGIDVRVIGNTDDTYPLSSVEEIKEHFKRGNVVGISAPEATQNYYIKRKAEKDSTEAKIYIAPNKKRRTQAEMNYVRLQEVAPHIFDGRYDYQKMQAGEAFMPLVFEKLYTHPDGSIEISLAHYYTQNGDLMADPDMELRIDFDKKTVEPLTFQNDGMGTYQRVYSSDGTKYSPALKKSLTSFLSQWTKNIQNDGYVIYKAIYNSELHEKLGDPSFDENGNEIGFEVEALPEGEVKDKNIYEPSKERHDNQFYMDEVLLRGSGFANGKQRIIDFYIKNDNNAERAKFLKNEYGIGGGSFAFSDERSGWTEHDGSGISFRFEVMEDDIEKYSYSKAAKRIGELMENGRYFEQRHDNEEPLKGIEHFNVQEQIDLFASMETPQQKEELPYERISWTTEEWEHYEEYDYPEQAINSFKEGIEICRIIDGDEFVYPIRTEDELRDCLSNNEILASVVSEDIKEKFFDIREAARIEIENKKETSRETLISEQPYHTITEESYSNVPYTKKERINANIEAIKTLKNIEEGIKANDVIAKELLSKYTGWGGLQEAFEEIEYPEIKEILTAEEYENARRSILSAYYTSPEITNTIYTALEKFGFEGGRILEPSMGTGNFIGTMPVNMRNKSAITGVELDSVSGRIAKALYPDVDVNITGYQNTNLKNNQFDVVVGNVPFGEVRIYDNDYKGRTLIHDYFFKKSLDKVRAGGIIALVTSSGTMDKTDDSMRNYISQRAEHIGSIRLNEDMFTGTKVTTDIIFLKKREGILESANEIAAIGTNADGAKMNKYFIDNPEMVIGKMVTRQGRFGEETACVVDENTNIKEQLNKAVHYLTTDIVMQPSISDAEQTLAINETQIQPEDVKNYSFIIHEGRLLYNNDNEFEEVPRATEGSVLFERCKDLIDVRDSYYDLLNAELQNQPNAIIEAAREKLNATYDAFIANETKRVANNKNKEVGINSDTVAKDFQQDDSYALLCSLETKNNDGENYLKAKVFFERTIRPERKIVSAKDAHEALIYSLSEKAKVDIHYISRLTGLPPVEVVKELEGEIYQNPTKLSDEDEFDGYETKSEYLSGNVVQKLKIAKQYQSLDIKYARNVEALESVQPEPLKASEISFKLGSTWIPMKVYEAFARDTFNVHYSHREYLNISFDPINARYEITERPSSHNKECTYIYGIGTAYHRNAYRILEDSLNQVPTTITHKVDDKVVINQKATMKARQKQELLQTKFKEWVAENYEVEKELVNIYNTKFNNLVQREFDGSEYVFPNQNPYFELRPHQKNAVARVLQTQNCLLAHEVGAGKTAVMATAGYEAKRLGIANKPLYVVPNHLVGQMAKEIYKIYPSSNLLVLDSQKDMNSLKRDTALGKIMTGNYDGIIMAHSSFDRIGISDELRRNILIKQLDELNDTIAMTSSDAKKSLRMLENATANIESKLEELDNRQVKSDLIGFDELGIDMLFVDEAQAYKNAPVYTKMYNVAGIGTAASGRANDMMAKIDYMVNNGDKVIFATGTPVSNTMTEMYVMQRYLQPEILKEYGLHSFDRWASTFAEISTDYELTIDSQTYKPKTRLAKFNNFPELMNMFKMVADIQTEETLNLPKPKMAGGKPKIIFIPPNEYVQSAQDELMERYEAITSGQVDRTEDNALSLTVDGRMIATDPRVKFEDIEDTKDFKVDAVAENVYDVWITHADTRATQMVFCDIGTPKKDQFDIYNTLKDKLVERGMPPEEIAFIHDCKNDKQKQELFHKMRTGEVRVMVGSTDKMGTGTNAQNKVIALHHIDVPWRPDQLVQRNGRGFRQGNMHAEVSEYRYVVGKTFDAYMWQLIETKNSFTSKTMTAKQVTVRTVENIDERALGYAEAKAAATDNPLIKEKMQVEAGIYNLQTLKQDSLNAISDLKKRVGRLETDIARQNIKIEKLHKDIEKRKDEKETEDFEIKVNKKTIKDKKTGVSMLQQAIKNIPVMPVGEYRDIGEYKGFTIRAEATGFHMSQHRLWLVDNGQYEFESGDTDGGTFTRINNVVKGLEKKAETYNEMLAHYISEHKLAQEKLAVGSTFAKQAELDELLARKSEIDKELKIKDDGKESPENDKTYERDFDR